MNGTKMTVAGLKITKSIILKLIILMLMALIGMLSGCGCEEYTRTTYSAPLWTKDGKILCQKYVFKGRKDPLFSGDAGEVALASDYYLTIMNADGSNETDLKRLSGYCAPISVSPVNGYIAYIYGDKVMIADSTGNDIGTVDYLSDWGPGDTKICYTVSDNLYVADISVGSNSVTVNNTKFLYANAYNPTWKYGDKIVFIFNNVSIIDMLRINPISKSLDQISWTGYSPQIHPNNQNVLFGVNPGVYKTDLETNSITNISNMDLNYIRLNFAGDKIVSYKTDSSQAGLYVLDLINTANITKIR